MDTVASKWIWEPSPEWIEHTNDYQVLKRLGVNKREEFLRYSTEHLEEFWAEMTREADIHWFQRFERVLDASRGVEWARWFVGGKINIADNCLDRHKDSRRPAILWEGED